METVMSNLVNHPVLTAIFLIIVLFYVVFALWIMTAIVTTMLERGHIKTIKDMERKLKELRATNERISAISVGKSISNLVFDKERPKLDQEDIEAMADSLNEKLKEWDKMEEYNKDLRSAFNERCQTISDLQTENFNLKEEVLTLQAQNKELSGYVPLEEIKKLEKENNELHHAVESLNDKICKQREIIKHQKERINHRKHTKPQPKETGYWECTNNKAYGELFFIGQVYEKGERKAYASTSLCLRAENHREYVVNRDDFKVAEKPERINAQNSCTE